MSSKDQQRPVPVFSKLRLSLAIENNRILNDVPEVKRFPFAAS